jgi:hypothetical protein
MLRSAQQAAAHRKPCPTRRVSSMWPPTRFEMLLLPAAAADSHTLYSFSGTLPGPNRAMSAAASTAATPALTGVATTLRRASIVAATALAAAPFTPERAPPAPSSPSSTAAVEVLGAPRNQPCGRVGAAAAARLYCFARSWLVRSCRVGAAASAGRMSDSSSCKQSSSSSSGSSS